MKEHGFYINLSKNFYKKFPKWNSKKILEVLNNLKMKKNLAITINQDLVLQVFGNHYKNNEEESFQIEELNLYRGNLIDYTDYLDGLRKYDLWEQLEQLCLDNIKENQ